MLIEPLVSRLAFVRTSGYRKIRRRNRLRLRVLGKSLRMRWRAVQSSLTSTMSGLQISLFLSRRTRSRPIQRGQRGRETSSCPCQSWAGSICISPHLFFYSLAHYVYVGDLHPEINYFWNKFIEAIVGICVKDLMLI